MKAEANRNLTPTRSLCPGLLSPNVLYFSNAGTSDFSPLPADVPDHLQNDTATFSFRAPNIYVLASKRDNHGLYTGKPEMVRQARFPLILQ